MSSSKPLSMRNNMYLFAIGVFFTKILNFVFAPIYSHYLTTGEFGSIDILTTTAYLIIPISTLAIAEAVLKYGIDDDSDLKKVFSSGLLVVLFGFGIITVFTAISGQFVYQEHLIPVLLYFLFECLFLFMQSFARAQKNVVAYVISSIIYSVVSISMIMLFLAWRNFGVTGYFYGLSIGVFTAIVFLIIATRAWKFVSFKNIDKSLLKQMVKYSAPLVLTNISYWIISGSDKYITRLVLGDHYSGLLSMVHKIPNLCTILFSIFNFAYVMSALKDHKLKKESYEEDSKFYSDLFKYVLVVLIFGSLLVSLVAYPVALLYKTEYLVAWVFIPLYSFGVILGAMRNFYSSIYCTQEKTLKIMLVVFIGATINALTCFLLMKYTTVGLWSTAISTILANGFIFLFYYFDSRKYVLLKIKVKEIVSLLLCLGISLIPCFTTNLVIFYSISGSLFAALAIFYFKDLLSIVKKMLPKFHK